MAWDLQILGSFYTNTKTHKEMDGNKPDYCPSPEVEKSITSRSRLSYPVEKLQRQTDSFLTAARLLRGGWSNEERNTRKQDSVLNISVHRSPLLKVDRGQGPRRAEIKSEEQAEGRQVPAVNIRKMSENGQTKAGNSEDKAKLMGVLTVEEQGGSKTGLYSQKDVVCVRVSSCRSACRRSRRFKPSVLPVIAEI